MLEAEKRPFDAILQFVKGRRRGLGKRSLGLGPILFNEVDLGFVRGKWCR